MKCQIKAFKQKPSNDGGTGDDNDEASTTTDTGDQFGGKASKRNRKTK